jgi:zinc transport system permease protein
MSFLEAVQSSPLLLSALLACLGASFASGIIGSFVVVKRVVSLSGSIAHSVLGGIGAALWLQRVHGWDWCDPLLGALFASLISALLIGWVHLYHKEREDAVISMIWSVGMAIGIIFASMTPGYNVELMHFLVGNVLWISTGDLLFLLALDALIFAAVYFYYKELLLLCFDETQAKLQRIPTKRAYFLLLGLIALSVVLLIHTVGVVLSISMLVLPASIAQRFTHKLAVMMGIACFLNLLFSVGGLALAYRLDWPTGATITLFSGCLYFLSLRFKRATRTSIPSPVSAEILHASN